MIDVGRDVGGDGGLHAMERSSGRTRYGVAEAIDQLPGYLVWRDRKAVLVVLIKNADPSAIIDRLHAAVETHPKSVLTKEGRHWSCRVDYIITADDQGRRDSLAVLPIFTLSRWIGRPSVNICCSPTGKTEPRRTDPASPRGQIVAMPSKTRDAVAGGAIQRSLNRPRTYVRHRSWTARDSRQNSLPSGSASTTQVASGGCPTSTRRAPSINRRSSST